MRDGVKTNVRAQMIGRGRVPEGLGVGVVACAAPLRSEHVLPACLIDMFAA